MRRAVRHSSFCKRARWKHENRRFISMPSTFFRSKAKVLFPCPWRRGRTFWKNYAPGQATLEFVTQARLVEMPSNSSRKCDAAAWKESSENYAIPFTNPAVEAAHGSN